ncbi:MAG: isoprenyl transferase [Chromatiales bacterium]|nr:isoprenyl transferase [Chromatiales bacterium]
MKASQERVGQGGAGIPAHVAIIMDGNGRWARARGMPRQAGHRAGVKAAREVVEACGRRGVKILTLFTFSSENWKRPKEEVVGLMQLFVEALGKQVRELHKEGIKVRFIGQRSTLNDKLRKQLEQAEELTRNNTRMLLNIALSYGGRWDIVNAAKLAIADAQAGRLVADDLDEESFSRYLSLSGQPDPDLFIRTGGETRISNFLLWNLAYTEMVFQDCLWPDFSDANLDAAIDSFAGRERRFGEVLDAAGAE